MSAVRLKVTSTPWGDWRALLEFDRTHAVVGYFSTWADAIREGCVAGRLQAAGISWQNTPPAPPELQELEAMPGDAYPPGAIPLDDLPADAVGRSLPVSLTFGEVRDGPAVLAYLDEIQRRRGER